MSLLTAEAGHGEVRLSWELPAGASAVMIRRATSGFPTLPTDGDAIYDGSDTSFTDESASNFTESFYAAFGHDGRGTFSSFPATARATPTFDPLAALSVAAGPGEVSLSWAIPAGAMGVMVRRGTAPSTDPTVGTEVYRGVDSSFADAAVTDHTAYFYAAFAYDDEGVLHPSAATAQARPPGWTAIAAGDYHSLAIAGDGSLWAWGDNEWGQLGVATTETCVSPRSDDFERPCTTTPLRVGGATDWTAIAAGEGHSVALRADGSLWSWGRSTSGEVGVAGVDVPTPTRIGADSTWTAIAAGESHSMALRADGTAWVWGNGGYGQIGDGSLGSRTSPTEVPTGSSATWTAVAAGGNACMGLRSDGTIWAWGRNLAGQLGTGDTGDLLVPTQIGADAAWSAIGMGYTFAAALRDDGTLWAWGSNGSHQLGDGTTDASYTPRQVGAATDWASLVVGAGHTLAQKRDGTLWAWGDNSTGQLGTGDRESPAVPTQVSAVGWQALSSRSGHTLALLDGALWAWGDNSHGQSAAPGAGTGTNDPRAVP
ncbi:MAG: hypothetical protein M5U28_31030 [Sandaracinaceae bacterium]|nr:hypothetical protein [Sandaracinaceae bacterium]